MQRVGSRAQVMHGNAKMTGGGLRKKDLKYNKQGKIVSKKMSQRAKKEKRLEKAGYTTRKGKFGAFQMIGGEFKRYEFNELYNLTKVEIDKTYENIKIFIGPNKYNTSLNKYEVNGDTVFQFSAPKKYIFVVDSSITRNAKKRESIINNKVNNNNKNNIAILFFSFIEADLDGIPDLDGISLKNPNYIEGYLSKKY